jgi:hypothetical protein
VGPPLEVEEHMADTIIVTAADTARFEDAPIDAMWILAGTLRARSYFPAQNSGFWQDGRLRMASEIPPV